MGAGSFKTVTVWTLVFSIFLVIPTQSSAKKLPKFISNDIAQNVTGCEKAKFHKGFIQRKADFNGDGVRDYIVDYGRYECDGFMMSYCGSDGCMADIFVSRSRGGWVKALSLYAQEYTVKKHGRFLAFVATVRNDKPADTDEVFYVWIKDKLVLVQRNK